MPAWMIATQVAAGLAGGAAVGILSMALLRRQVEAVAGGRGGVGLALAGLAGRLVLVGGGMAAALVWSVWCGLAYAAALVVTRIVMIRKARIAP